MASNQGQNVLLFRSVLYLFLLFIIYEYIYYSFLLLLFTQIPVDQKNNIRPQKLTIKEEAQKDCFKIWKKIFYFKLEKATYLEENLSQ
jgi:hypothetical protein